MSAVSQTLPSVLSTSAAYKAQAQSFFLPSFPFFASDVTSPHWVAAWFCQRQGVLCHGAVGRERVLPAPTASFSSCLVPSTASCAEIFNSPASSVLGRRQELLLSAQGTEEAAAWGLEQLFLLHPFFWREQWLGLAFI